MEAFLVSVTTIATAEMGDRTQLLSLVLAARYRKPVPIVAGILCATILNHAAAAWLGVWFGSLIKPAWLLLVVGASMIGMALWTLKPDQLQGEATALSTTCAFVATLGSFFVAEIGDKTQIATLALAASYAGTLAVIAGTTTGMMIANVPVVILGQRFSDRLPMTAIRYAAASLFVVLGMVFLVRGLWR